MEESEKDIKMNNKISEEETDEDFLQIDNLNINQEVDIKENPKKHIVNTKKKHILKNSLDDNYIDSENENNQEENENDNEEDNNERIEDSQNEEANENDATIQ